MKEDILEQLVEDWFVARESWFVKHNVKYRPRPDHPDYESNKDSVHSDIDILALSATERKGPKRVAVVTCKSWQGGFNSSKWKTDLEGNAEYHERSAQFRPREPWKYFRELVSPKWTEAFLAKLQEETGQIDFTYLIAITKHTGTHETRIALERSEIIRDRFLARGSRMQVELITLKELLDSYWERIQTKATTSLEATDVGRLLQLAAAAGLRFEQ